MESKATRARVPIKARFRSGLRVKGPCHWLRHLKLPSTPFIFNIAVIIVVSMVSIFINAAVGDVSMQRSSPYHHPREGLPYDMEVTTRPKIETNQDLWFASFWAGLCYGGLTQDVSDVFFRGLVYVSAGMNCTAMFPDVISPNGVSLADLGGSVLYVLTEDPEEEARGTSSGFLVANGKACGCAFPAHQRFVKHKRVLGYWVQRWPHPVVLFKPRRVFEYVLRALSRGFFFYGLGRLCPISVNRRSQGGKRRIPSGRAPIGFILLLLFMCFPVALGADSGAKSSGTRDGFPTWWLSFLGMAKGPKPDDAASDDDNGDDPRLSAPVEAVVAPTSLEDVSTPSVAPGRQALTDEDGAAEVGPMAAAVEVEPESAPTSEDVQLEKIAGQPWPEAAFDAVRLPPVGSIIKMVNKLMNWPEIPQKAVLRVNDGKPLASARQGHQIFTLFTCSS